MSDIDEMELDEEHATTNDVTFSSEQKGKKLSKANLPVSAGDTLPWFVFTYCSCRYNGGFFLSYSRLTSIIRVEKYRPDTLNDVSGHEDILTTSKLALIT